MKANLVHGEDYGEWYCKHCDYIIKVSKLKKKLREISWEEVKKNYYHPCCPKCDSHPKLEYGVRLEPEDVKITKTYKCTKKGYEDCDVIKVRDDLWITLCK